MKKYLIQFKGELELEAEDSETALEQAISKFDEISKVAKVSDAKVVDKSSGYFIKS